MSNILRDEDNDPLFDESGAPGDKLLDENAPATPSAQEVHGSDTTYIRRRREK